MSGCPFSGFFAKPDEINEEQKLDEKRIIEVLHVHPSQGIRLEKANKKLKSENGSDEKLWNDQAYKYCGPFTSANSIGWWVYPALDFDVTYLGDKKFEYTFHEKYYDDDACIFKELKDKDKDANVFNYDRPQSKYDFGLTEINMLQLWTGRSFRTPKNWCLFITNPINCYEHHNRPWHIQSGFIESDWFPGDIWTNILFHRTNEKFQFRKDMWPPLAQIIPMHIHSVHGDWELKDTYPSFDNELYLQRNKYWYEKFVERGEKQPKHFYKERAKVRSDGNPLAK